MPLFKLRLQVDDAAAAQAAADLLGELASPAALAVTLFADRPPGYAVEAYYADEPAPDLIDGALAPLNLRISPAVVQPVPDANWVALSQASLPPVAAGRFIVHGSHDRARFSMRRYAIEIEAGEAFGTGHSATTAGCLEALDALLRRRRFVRMLDLGCGTGVLAIAAARLSPGAQAFASDSDPTATAVARANVRLNRVAGRIRIITATGFGHPLLRAAQPFDLVLANILPGPLIDLAPAMRRVIRPGGAAILSGVLIEQARAVRAAYLACGFRLLRQRRLGEWTILTLLRA